MQNNDLDPMQVKVIGQGKQIFCQLSQMLLNEHARSFIVIRLAVFVHSIINIIIPFLVHIQEIKRCIQKHTYDLADSLEPDTRSLIHSSYNSVSYIGH
jgi:hypothetical protein